LASAVLLVVPCLAAAHPAVGVHVDPGSPAGREYAIPLAQARASAVGDGGDGQLFGVGISSAAAGGARRVMSGMQSSKASTSLGMGKVGRSASGPAVSPNRTVVKTNPEARRSDLSIPPPGKILDSGHGDVTGILWMLTVAGAVLVAGGVGGTLLTRR
jgi:hypothetical protein